MQAMLTAMPAHVEDDQWLAFNNASLFNVSKAYLDAMGNQTVCPTLKWLWKTCCQQKHKVFFWLVQQDRLNTSKMLQRKNILWLIIHVPCLNPLGWNLAIIFFQCPFATLC
jgi:hypothetical protein